MDVLLCFYSFPRPAATEGTKALVATGNQAAIHGSLLTPAQGTGAHAAAICVVSLCPLCSFFEGELATCAAFVIGNPPPPPPPPAIPAMYFGAIAPPPPDAACRCLLLHAIAVGARDLLHALKRCGRRHPLSSSRHCCGLFSVVLRSDWAGMASMARARRGAWGFAPKWASGRA